MSPFYLAGNALNFTPEVTVKLVEHWYFAGFLTPEKFSETLRYLQLPQHEIDRSVNFLNQCVVNSVFDAEKFCNEFYGEDERFAIVALALLQYNQQTHFLPGVKEISNATPVTKYTESHADSIRKLAIEMNLLGPVNSLKSVDAIFLIGGRSITNDMYLRHYREQQAIHNLGIPYLFLSPRALLNDAGDNPNKGWKEKFELNSSCDDYFSYLYDFLNEHHGEILSKYPGLIRYKEDGDANEKNLTEDVFHSVIQSKQKIIFTEGFALLERYTSRFGWGTSAEFVYTGTKESDDFYKAAIKKQMARNNLNSNGNSHFAIISIQPYVQTYINNVRNFCFDLGIQAEVVGYGGEAVVTPEALVRAMAMLINSQYQQAAKALFKQLDIEAFPGDALLARVRGKPINLRLPESYQQWMRSLTKKEASTSSTDDDKKLASSFVFAAFFARPIVENAKKNQPQRESSNYRQYQPTNHNLANHHNNFHFYRNKPECSVFGGNSKIKLVTSVIRNIRKVL